jgi:nicotinate-nucleotide pyrophosphorylase (carboxylating)
MISAALDEDLGTAGDLTTDAVVAAGASVDARLEAREPLVVAGLPLAEPTLQQVAERGLGSAAVEPLRSDGDRVGAGEILARIRGSAHAILAAERLLLNLVGRLSGIATVTAECVAEVSGTGARIADTRKTTPLLRELEKYAVTVGGGESHRPGLDALVLIKDNHKLIAGGIARVIERLRAGGRALGEMEIEVEDLEEVRTAAEAGFGWILLDNMPPEVLGEAIALVGGRARIEVSGGLKPGRLHGVAALGVDRLSLGWLTHGARSVDVALEIDRRP